MAGMKCPVCEVENPEGATTCRSCKGTLSPSGVDYSGLSREVDWQDGSVLSEEDVAASKRAAAYYPVRVMRLLFYLVMTGILSSVFLYSGYSYGDDGYLFLGLAMLAGFTISLWSLWKVIRAAYSGPDTKDNPLSVQDMDKEIVDLTRLPPRR